MKKAKDFKLDDVINFNFLGTTLSGKVIDILVKENRVKVIDNEGIIYQAHMSDKDSKFCYIE
jgi:hypothetical protein